MDVGREIVLREQSAIDSRSVRCSRELTVQYNVVWASRIPKESDSSPCKVVSMSMNGRALTAVTYH